jgi:hypothetical protein
MLPVMAFVVGAVLITPVARAGSISLQLANDTLATTSGGTVTFQGRVTNNSGQDLNASDFFFNFVGFDPTSVAVIQDLGVASDVPVPNGTTSDVLAVFDVTVGPVPPGSSFQAQVQLEDVSFDLTPMQTITVLVNP